MFRSIHMSKRWSKLQSKLYAIMIDDFQIHVAVYNQNGITSSNTNKLPRYWITLGKEIVFDYPRLCENPYYYPWDSDMSSISDVIEEYLSYPKSEILNFSSEKDYYGIAEFLKVCDKRIGKRRFSELKNILKNEKAIKILESR